MITQEQLKKANVFGQNTWPYVPAGTRPTHSNNVAIQMDTSRDLQWQEIAMDRLVDRLKDFKGDLKTTSSWLFAAFVSLGVNFIFAALYSVPQKPNLPVFGFGLALFVIFVLMAIFSLPSNVNMKLAWAPGSTGWLFNQSQSNEITDAIESDKLTALAQIKIQPLLFPEDMNSYAHLICLANFRDRVHRKKRTYVNITRIATMGGGGKSPFLAVIIDVKNRFRLSVSRNINEKVESEGLDLVGALGDAKRTTGVYAFDYDPASWREHGSDFLNEYSKWNIDELERTLLSQIIGQTPIAN